MENLLIKCIVMIYESENVEEMWKTIVDNVHRSDILRQECGRSVENSVDNQ